MRQFFSDILVQMRGIWARLESQQRFVVGAVLFATIAGLGAMVYYAGKPSYEVVFTSSSSDDLTKAAQALTSSQVTFIEDGYHIKVERSDRGRAQSALTKEGIGSTESPGLAASNMMEDAATKQWRLDAASRSLAQDAIAKLDGVVDVSVSASKPRRLIAYRSRSNTEKASATVILRLRPGTQFMGLAHNAASIAASQLMIPIENIDVVRAVGGQRWRYNPDREEGGGSSEFLEMQRNMSDARTRVAQERLDQLWPGKTAVQVHVELDPTWKIESRKIIPEEQLVKSEDTTKDSTEATTDAGGGSSNEKKTKEYVTEIGLLRTGSMMPAISRVSVAVLYDESLKNDQFEKDLERVVKVLAGWDETRDDPHFSMMSGPFVPQEAPIELSSGPSVTSMIVQWGPMVGQVLGVIVVVLFLRGLFKKTRRPVGPAEDPVAAADEEDLSPEELQKRMRREIEQSIASDPAAMAKMLEQWLVEQKV